MYMYLLLPCNVPYPDELFHALVGPEVANFLWTQYHMQSLSDGDAGSAHHGVQQLALPRGWPTPHRGVDAVRVAGSGVEQA